jgi:hypothetical protein
MTGFHARSGCGALGVLGRNRARYVPGWQAALLSAWRRAGLIQNTGRRG